MADPTSSTDTSLVAVEPASVAELARLVVGILVTTGVFNFDDAMWNAITLIIGGLLSVGLTLWTRSRVSPAGRVTGGST